MTQTLQPLPQSLALFRHFDECGVPYCHFKSNEHLLEGLAGVTDLDLLVARQRARVGQGALQGAGFKRFASKFAASYPAVEDYLGFDTGTGRLIHAHVYYALVVGEPYLKGYQLGFDDSELATRVADPATGVYTSDPSYEMLLLLIRYALKSRLRDCAWELVGKPFFDAAARREHSWLANRLQLANLHRITEEQLGKAAGEMIDALVATPPSVSKLRAFRRRAAEPLSRCRSFGPLEVYPVRIAREVSALLSVINRRLLRLPIPLRRIHPAGGRIIALVGPDGSGKSTLAEEIRGWLAWKLDVYPVYFGSGDGPSSLLRRPLKAMLPLVRRVRGSRARMGSGGGQSSEELAGAAPRRISAVRALWALVLALEKRSKMRASVKARNRGMIVICDRYPQVQTMGFNDGPLLSPWIECRSSLKRRLARWEFETYRRLTLTPPDLVVKLDVTPEASTSRSPETAAWEVKRRRVAVRRIDYGPSSETLEVDATQPLADVLLEVKAAIWAQL